MATAEKRNTSTTAPQSLTLLNSDFMEDQSAALAERIEDVRAAWQAVYARDPSTEELRAAQAFVKRQKERFDDDKAARKQLARSLLNSNEFLYVD
ncbi:MAG: DUF1553 domain-containing protein [Acidobacteria bacterium]|nr:DUF1553 domain-containing protein [Acidobacteriota bacterium]MDA1235786.1 DUF1553 domain-containing protein [Acidobacteriota bacterium]